MWLFVRIVALGLAVLAARDAAAQRDPFDCTPGTVPVVAIEYTTGGPGPISCGTQIFLTVKVGHPGGTECNFGSGRIALRLPNGRILWPARSGIPILGKTQTIHDGTAYVSPPIEYFVAANDALPSGQISFTATYVTNLVYSTPIDSLGEVFTLASTTIVIPVAPGACATCVANPGTCPPCFLDSNLCDPCAVNQSACISDCGAPALCYCEDELDCFIAAAPLGVDLECVQTLPSLLAACLGTVGISYCDYLPLPGHPPCDDGDPCTEDDRCAFVPTNQHGPVCVGTPRSCDDFDPCTQDACDGSTGACVHTPQSAFCLPNCGNGVLDAGEECDDGNTTPNDCCSPLCRLESSATVCRPAAGECDQPETCNAQGLCPPDAKLAGTECRPAGDSVCAPAAFCDGTNDACSLDPLPPNTACEDGNICTVGDHCDGALCVGTLFECDATASAARLRRIQKNAPVADVLCRNDTGQPIATCAAEGFVAIGSGIARGIDDIDCANDPSTIQLGGALLKPITRRELATFGDSTTAKIRLRLNPLGRKVLRQLLAEQGSTSLLVCVTFEQGGHQVSLKRVVHLARGRQGNG